MQHASKTYYNFQKGAGMRSINETSRIEYDRTIENQCAID